MFIKADSKIILDAIKRFMNQKPVLSNYFITDLEDVEYYWTEKTVIIRKNEDDYYRLYCLTLELNDLKEILNKIKGDYAINIPSRGAIENWSELLKSCGFELIGVYERYFNPKPPEIKVFNAHYADINHFDKLKNLMFSNFNKYSDHLPNDKLLGQMIENKQIIIHENGEELLGLFIYSLKGKRCDLQCWIDKSGAGLFLFLNIFGLMKLNKITCSQSWINSQNKVSKKIHDYFGFKPDNLKDYTFHRVN